MTNSAHSESVTERKSLASVGFLAIMTVVIGVRITSQAVGYFLALPFATFAGYLPDSDGVQFPRLHRFKKRTVAYAESQLPDWAEHTGSGLVMLQTQRGQGLINVIADAVSDRVVSVWERFAVVSMVFLLSVWAVVLTAAIMLWGRFTVASVADVARKVLSGRWLQYRPHDRPPSINWIEVVTTAIESAPEIAVSIAVLGLMLAVAIILTWGVMLLVLPGLVLHEIGHYLAIRRAGVAVESYGLLLYGPVLAGAYVEPADEIEDASAWDTFPVWAGGIANNLLWGAVLLLAGVLAGGQPVAVLQALLGGSIRPVLAAPLASTLVAIGCVEFGNAFFNSLPFSKVDGGGFVRTIEREWWGISGVVGFKQRIHHLLVPIGRGSHER